MSAARVPDFLLDIDEHWFTFELDLTLKAVSDPGINPHISDVLISDGEQGDDFGSKIARSIWRKTNMCDRRVSHF